MPSINQFDGPSLFAGNNFMPSQSTQAPDPAFSAAKSNHGPQSLVPVTVRQIAESLFSSDDKSNLVIDGVEANFRVLGVVVDKVERATDVSFLLDDGTGKIEINRWISVSVPSDSVEVAAVENGMYVLVHGHVKEFQGRRHAFAFSIRPVIDFNDISLHFIECICVHLENTRLKGGAPTRIQMNPVINLTLANGTNGYQTPLSNQFPQNSGMGASKNDICSVVLGIFQEPSILAREHGLHIDEVFRSLGVPKNMILEAINYLVDVGHIYSTIDEYHFKSASSGYQ